ncbi:MAG: hypothetical protein ACRD16_06160 [Thermoanaerobaculia bacterium]
MAPNWKWLKFSRTSSRCVVFVVQWLETFEMVKPVVVALRQTGKTAKIVVTPERDMPHRNSDGSYNLPLAAASWEWLLANGFDPEPLLPPEREAQRLRDLRPSAVFLASPYDGIRHESLAPSRLGLPVHYVDYFFRIGPNAFGSRFEDSFFRECSAVYVNNDYEAEQYSLAGVPESRLVRSGPPVLDHWDAAPPRAKTPTVLWCPWWSTRWDGSARGYSTFIPAYEAVLAEASRRPHMRFIFRPHPSLWSELKSEALWTDEDARRFHERVAELDNVTLAGGVTPTQRSAFYPDHIEQFEQAWAMVTDGMSFLAEFGYTGKPLLLTQARGNPGWNPVGQAIADVVERSDGIEKLSGFLDRVEQGLDPDADRRKEAIRRQFYRPPGGSGAAIARHLAQLRE